MRTPARVAVLMSAVAEFHSVLGLTHTLMLLLLLLTRCCGRRFTWRPLAVRRRTAVVPHVRRTSRTRICAVQTEPVVALVQLSSAHRSHNHTRIRGGSRNMCYGGRSLSRPVPSLPFPSPTLPFPLGVGSPLKQVGGLAWGRAVSSPVGCGGGVPAENKFGAL